MWLAIEDRETVPPHQAPRWDIGFENPGLETLKPGLLTSPLKKRGQESASDTRTTVFAMNCDYEIGVMWAPASAVELADQVAAEPREQ